MRKKIAKALQHLGFCTLPKDSLTDRSLLRDEASKTWRPRLLRSVVNDPSAVDRDALIDPPFHRERREAAVGFQVQHPQKKDSETGKKNLSEKRKLFLMRFCHVEF